jgi:hypothetical protein
MSDLAVPSVPGAAFRVPTLPEAVRSACASVRGKLKLGTLPEHLCSAVTLGASAQDHMMLVCFVTGLVVSENWVLGQ